MVTNRSQSVSVPGSNQGYGVDAAFSFFENVGVERVLGAHRDAWHAAPTTTAIRGWSDYGGDRYGAHLEYLKVGRQLQSRGRVRAARELPAHLRHAAIQPAAEEDQGRPASSPTRRTIDNFVNGDGALETRIETGSFNAEFENSDSFSVIGDARVRAARAGDAGRRRHHGPRAATSSSSALVSYGLGSQRRRVSGHSLVAGRPVLRRHDHVVRVHARTASSRRASPCSSSSRSSRASR